MPADASNEARGMTEDADTGPEHAPPGVRPEADTDGSWLEAVADAASRGSGGPVELLGDYPTLLADAAVYGRRAERPELEAVGELGRRAAETGIPAGRLVDLYLSAAWRPVGKPAAHGPHSRP